MIRRIIHIDEEKCNGCGACADACHESAIGMVDGKAKLLRDDYCDGTMPNAVTVFIPRITKARLILFPIPKAGIGYITPNTIIEIIDLISPHNRSIKTSMHI